MSWLSGTISLGVRATGTKHEERARASFRVMAAASQLPMRQIPGDYGPPLTGAIKDRQDFFYNQGRELFFRSRMDKYNSTVFRANMPPGPFISNDSRVIVLLDGKSFPILFDVSKVEKKDLFVGTYMPSLELTGGYRVLSYLDPSEINHYKIKTLLFSLLMQRRDHVIPSFQSTYSALFDSFEAELASSGKSPFSKTADEAAFTFTNLAYFGVDPTKSALGTGALDMISKWTLFQIGPIMSLGLPKYADDLLLHNKAFPPALVKNDYAKLTSYFQTAASFLFPEAESMGISADETVHNIIFATCFNTFGGLKILFPLIIKNIGQAGAAVHAALAKEIRSAIAAKGGNLMAAMEAMPLMKSAVYEVFRIDPPVPYQYGKAKMDLVIESHDNTYQVKKGEMMFGFQPFATRDPKIFDRADAYVPDRFVGAGEQMLKHILWSNGPETESPTTENKQCAGKNFVMLVARLFVVQLFTRYDSFAVEVSDSVLGSTVSFTSLKKAAT